MWLLKQRSQEVDFILYKTKSLLRYRFASTLATVKRQNCMANKHVPLKQLYAVLILGNNN